MPTCAACHRAIKTGKDGRIVMHGQRMKGQFGRRQSTQECVGSFLVPTENHESADMLAAKLAKRAELEPR